MIVGGLRVGASEGSVGLGDILEFPFSIQILGDIGMKTLCEGAESRLDFGARSTPINLQGCIVILAAHCLLLDLGGPLRWMSPVVDRCSCRHCPKSTRHGILICSLTRIGPDMFRPIDPVRPQSQGNGRRSEDRPERRQQRQMNGYSLASAATWPRRPAENRGEGPLLDLGNSNFRPPICRQIPWGFKTGSLS